MAFTPHRDLFWLGTLPPLMGLAADTPNELQLPKLPDFFFPLWTPGLCKYNFLYPVHSYLPVKIKDCLNISISMNDSKPPSLGYVPSWHLVLSILQS